jgi:hypothetical protein
VWNFPLGREVVEKLFEDFTVNEVVARGFFWFEMVDDSLHISMGKTVDWRDQTDMGSLRLVGWILRLRGHYKLHFLSNDFLGIIL